MIAKVSAMFGDNKTLLEKISYNIAKIEEGKGEYLYDNFGEMDIHKLYNEMKEVGQMNNRVDKKYFEVSLNLVPGEPIDNDKFLKIAQDYMDRMGCGDCCYAVIRHSDREHQHLHILSTTIDYEGNHISNSQNFRKSQTISRDLEIQYNLEKVEYNKFNNQCLSKIKEREYYFSNALYKGLRDFSTKNELLRLISDELNFIEENRFTNDELVSILGKEVYNKVGGILEKNNHFSTLYKHELLQKLDLFYASSNNKHDFFEKVHAAGLYVRTVADKSGKLKYTYGLPSANIYFKDDSLPQKYRYSSIDNFISPGQMTVDNQKSAIASKAIVALKNSNSFESYLLELEKIGVIAKLHQNNGGVYGMSFQLKDIENPVVLKASEITSDRGFSFSNVTKYFNGDKSILDHLFKSADRVGERGTSMSTDEQKVFIRDIVKAVLPMVKDVDELRERLLEKGISLWVRKSNLGEVQGFSFKIKDCLNAVPIKARDVSANFDKELFRSIQTLHASHDERIKARYQNFTGQMNRFEQKEYIRIVTQDALKLHSNRVEDFTKILEMNGVSFTINKVGNITMDFSFKMMNRGEALKINAREISKEFASNLFECFASDEVKVTVKSSNADVTYLPSTPQESEAFIDLGPVGGKTDTDNTDLKKKKKKKKKNMDFGL